MGFNKKNNKSDVIVVVAASYLLLIFGDVNFVIHRSKRALIWFNVITCRHFSNHIHLRSFISITLAILNEKLILRSDNLPLNSLPKYETVLIATIIKSQLPLWRYNSISIPLSFTMCLFVHFVCRIKAGALFPFRNIMLPKWKCYDELCHFTILSIERCL